MAALETPLSFPYPTTLDWLSRMLPAQQTLQNLIALALDEAIVAHECLDRDELWTHLADITNNPSSISLASNQSFVAVVYALLALGEAYMGSRESPEPTIRQDPNRPRG